MIGLVGDDGVEGCVVVGCLVVEEELGDCAPSGLADPLGCVNSAS